MAHFPWEGEASDYACPQSPTSSTSSASYADHESLIADLQSLLSDIHSVADVVANVGNESHPVALHTQLLSSRSPYFAAAFSRPWRQPEIAIPHVSDESFADLLEFLYTGAVRLEVDTGSPVSIAATAHYFGVDELEQIVVDHVEATITPNSFPTYVLACHALPDHAVPPRITAALSSYAAKFPSRILTSTALYEAPKAEAELVASTIWALLAFHRTTSDERVLSSYVGKHGVVYTAVQTVSSSAVEGLLAWSSRHRMLWNLDGGEPLRAILSGTTCALSKSALADVLTAVPTRFFALRVEPLGIVPETLVVGKYRDDALVPTSYESPHPCPRTSHRCRIRLQSSARGCRIVFDSRTSLGEGTALNFYLRYPSPGGRPAHSVSGSSVSDELSTSGFAVAHPTIWFVLEESSSDAAEDLETRPGQGQRYWGYKFMIEPLMIR